MKLRETLKDYRGVLVDVTTDEEIGDILVAIKYHDHGDEFLYVKTYSGEEYEYGYYLNRCDCCYNFDITKNSGESDGIFIRRPIMFYDMTPRKVVDASNNVFRIVHDDCHGMTNWMTTLTVEKRSNAECILNTFIRTVENVIESKVYYNFEHHKELVKEFVILNGLGEEALDRIEKIKWTIEGLAGIAGKQKGMACRLYMDGIISVLYRGKRFDDKIHLKHEGWDYWGYDRYSLSLRQFQ